MQGNVRKRSRRLDEQRAEEPYGSSKRCAAQPELVYQLLCPTSRIGHIIGKGGVTIEQLRQTTQAHIKVERETPGCLERLICFSSATGALEAHCRAQEALLCVQDRLAAVDSADLVHMARLLVPDSNVGAIMGKKGETLAELRKSSGATIRVHDSHETPSCGRSTDRVVAVKGEAEVVRRVLRDLTSILRACTQSRPSELRPPAFNITAVATSAVQRQPHPELPMSRHADAGPPGSFRGQDAPDLAHHSRAGSLQQPPGRPLPPPHPSEVAHPIETQLRCLVPASDIGHVIGRKGETVQSMRDRSGATIKVHEGNSERKGMDRLVTLSSNGLPGRPGCPAQQALRLVCQACFAIPGRSPLSPIRLLVPAEQVGAVLGKGGATISQIRSDSGATVRLVGLDPDEERHLPRDLGSGQHRVISIAGDPDCALRALTAVTDLLQECQARNQLGAGSRPSARPPSCHMSAGAACTSGHMPGAMPFQVHGAKGAYASSSGSPYDSPSRGDMLFDATHTRHAGGAQEHSSRFNPASGLGNEPGKLAKELRLVGVQVGCVLGKSGENIGQIRKISGAMVKMSDAPRGVSERMLRLTGFPEQVQAAMNLVQAFLLAGGAGSLDQAAALTYPSR